MYLTDFTDHELSEYLDNQAGTILRVICITGIPVNEYWKGNQLEDTQLIAIVVFNNETSTRRIYVHH